ncbi:iron-sulfur cluster biosynthesis family protein [Bacillus sp. AK128]
MEVVLKPLAIQQFNSVSLQENEGIRIEAIFIGSCAVFVEYHLFIDKKHIDDSSFQIEGIQVLVSKESEKHLPDTIYIDYSPNLGYKIYSAEETFRYNLALVKRT